MRISRFERALTRDMLLHGVLALTALVAAEVLARSLELWARGDPFTLDPTRLRLPLLVFISAPLGASTAVGRHLSSGAGSALGAAGVGLGPWLRATAGYALVTGAAFASAVRAAPAAAGEPVSFILGDWWIHGDPPRALGPDGAVHAGPFTYHRGAWQLGEGIFAAGPSPQALRAAMAPLGTWSRVDDASLRRAARALGHSPTPRLRARAWRRHGPWLLSLTLLGAVFGALSRSQGRPRALWQSGWLWAVGPALAVQSLNVALPESWDPAVPVRLVSGLTLAGILLSAAPGAIRRSQSP